MGGLSCRPGFASEKTENGPPPPWTPTAKNSVLALMYCCSPATLLRRRLVKHPSALAGSQNTCLYLEVRVMCDIWLTMSRLLLLADDGHQTFAPVIKT